MKMNSISRTPARATIVEFLSKSDSPVDVSQIVNFLRTKNLSTNKTKIGSVKYFLTDVTPETEKVAEMFLGKKLTSPIKKVNLD